MDTLTEEDVLGQYYDNNNDDDSSTSTFGGGGSSSSASLHVYADFRPGWGSCDVNDELYSNMNNEISRTNES
jgi:hypothetical protein